MFKKNKMIKEQLKTQAAVLSTKESQQNLLRSLQERAVRINDSNIRDLIIRIRNKINEFAPCADQRAIVLDSKMLIMVDTFLDQLFYIDENNLLDDATTEQINTYKQQANLKMFEELWTVLQAQLQARKVLMSDTEKTQAEIDKMRDFERAAYLRKQASRERVDSVWVIQSTIMDYNLRLANIFCQIQCKKYQMQEIVNKSLGDEANNASYMRQYSMLKSEVSSLENQEEDIIGEIKANQGITDLINLTDLRKLYDINNSEKGMGVAAMATKLAEDALKLSEIYAEQTQQKSTAVDMGLNALKGSRAQAPSFDSDFAEAQERTKMQSAAATQPAEVNEFTRLQEEARKKQQQS